jgi:hypothetical protein
MKSNAGEWAVPIQIPDPAIGRLTGVKLHLASVAHNCRFESELCGHAACHDFTERGAIEEWTCGFTDKSR